MEINSNEASTERLKPEPECTADEGENDHLPVAPLIIYLL